MITPAHAQLMAKYNSWQNRSLYGAADGLSDDDRRLERGAFFGSIHATLNHILWGDQMWLSRFAGTPAPPAPNQPIIANDLANWEGLKSTRVAFDKTIEDWANGLSDASLAGDLTWRSGLSKREMTKPKWMLITHFFNHQTHHRGQVHCMLTQVGAKPDDTDIPWMPD